MPTPRILTFNFHEPYLCLMAKTGLPMDVGSYAQGPLQRVWHDVFRPVPPGVTLVEEPVWRERLAVNYYDVVIAHNEMNALDVAKARCGKLLVCHNRRTFLNTTVTIDGDSDPVAAFDKLLQFLGERFEFVFISESKRADYGMPGRVILPGIDLDEYTGYRGDAPQVVRVGNTMRQRTLMFDVDFQEAVCADVPNVVYGVNPEIPDAQVARSWDALREVYRTYRCMLHVSREAYEDGYNLAMLEAMATGMPVVALANPTSPITDGVDGFVSYDAAILRERLQALLADPELARQIGQRGRETVGRLFSLEAFVARWREAIIAAAERSTRPAWHRAQQPARNSPPPGAPRLLLHYCSSPLTTGRYFEEAARAHFEVQTAGFRIPEEVLHYWGFEGPPPRYPEQGIPTELRTPYAEILGQIPASEKPDLYLWIDSGTEQVESDSHLLDAPKIGYLIDTHVTPELRLAMARHFDAVYLAQKAQVDTFRAQGIPRASWLPLACEPSLHNTGPRERVFDWAYVGSLSPEENGRRRRLLDGLAQQFPNHFLGRAWPDDMAQIYARAKVVVNACHNRDVNMRVFEAMASGAMLLTDEAEGLEDLFADGEHLVIYRNDSDLPALLDRYLHDDAARTRIAAAGQALVLREHTYAHRMAVIAEAGKAMIAEREHEAQQLSEKSDKAYYQCPRREIIPFVPLHTRRLLDVGCGQGALARVLREERGLEEVSGIEIIESAWREARKVLDTCLLGSIEAMELPFPDNHFDCIICADVLEHLVEPSAALRKLARVLKDDGSIVISIPNIRYYEVVGMLAGGAWAYQDAGIMDSTHLRFFCKPDLYDLVEAAGLRVAALQPLSMRDEKLSPRAEDGSFSVGMVTYHHLSDEDYEGLRVYQYAVIACKPGVDRLGPARRALDHGEYEAAVALAVNATGAAAWEQRAVVAKAWAKSGRLADAEGMYRQALDEHDDPATRADLGTLLLALGRAKEARPLLESALLALPEADRIHAALGLADLSDGELASAFDRLLAALRTSNAHIALWSHVLPLARELNRVDEIVPTLREYAEFYPGNAELCVALATILIDLGQVSEARERLETLLMFEPGHQEAAAQLARCNAP